MAYDAFVEIKNLLGCSDKETISKIEVDIRMIFGEDIIFSFPNDSSVTSGIIPVVAEVTLISTVLKSLNVPTVREKLERVHEALMNIFPKRWVIVFLRKAEITIQ